MRPFSIGGCKGLAIEYVADTHNRRKQSMVDRAMVWNASMVT